SHHRRSGFDGRTRLPGRSANSSNNSAEPPAGRPVEAAPLLSPAPPGVAPPKRSADPAAEAYRERSARQAIHSGPAPPPWRLHLKAGPAIRPTTAAVLRESVEAAP